MDITVVNYHSYRFAYKVPGTWVGRGSALGNPYSHKEYPNTIRAASREDAIAKYSHWLKAQLDDPDSEAYAMFLALAERAVTGERLVLKCACKPKACHGDVIKSAIENLLKEVIA